MCGALWKVWPAALIRVGRLSSPPFPSGESFLISWGQLGKMGPNPGPFLLLSLGRCPWAQPRQLLRALSRELQWLSEASGSGACHMDTHWSLLGGRPGKEGTDEGWCVWSAWLLLTLGLSIS